MLNKFTAVLIIISAFVATPAFAEGPKRPLVLSGHGEIKMAPDMAIVELGTLSQAPTAKAALDANTAKMSALIALLKSAGIDDKDIQTSNFSVGPRYDNSTTSGQAEKIVGYDVNNGVSVIVHKLDGLGAILDKAVSAGSNQINGISFGIANSQSAQDEARKAAVADALRKATLLTEAAGVKLGALQSMSEQGGNIPMPMQMGMAKVAR
ncbi:MAG: SIMPL domain-containing protein, partial [Pseudomonadota bacterium]|nr:SIMPL domain-containing protein [Pseudomonadota bacterium]